MGRKKQQFARRRLVQQRAEWERAFGQRWAAALQVFASPALAKRQGVPLGSVAVVCSKEWDPRSKMQVSAGLAVWAASVCTWGAHQGLWELSGDWSMAARSLGAPDGSFTVAEAQEIPGGLLVSSAPLAAGTGFACLLEGHPPTWPIALPELASGLVVQRILVNRGWEGASVAALDPNHPLAAQILASLP